jgi:hypothetical protein
VNVDANGSDNHEMVFETRLKKIGRVVALLDKWDNPRYLTRIWTIFEQFTAQKLEIPVTMILPADCCESLMNEIDKGKAGLETVRRALSQISSERAKASYEKDEAAVKDLIMTTSSFEDVDKAVARTMISWVAGVVQDRFLGYLDADVPTNEQLVQCYTDEGPRQSYCPVLVSL